LDGIGFEFGRCHFALAMWPLLFARNLVASALSPLVVEEGVEESQEKIMEWEGLGMVPRSIGIPCQLVTSFSGREGVYFMSSSSSVIGRPAPRPYWRS
jgi:hypothetical protein